MRFLAGLWRFALSLVVLTALVGAAWAAAFATFRREAYLELALPVGLVAVIAWVAYWLGAWRRIRTTPTFILFAFSSALLVYGALCGLHFAPQPRTRFAFLGDREMMFSTDPGLPGLVGATYSFPEDPHKVMDTAKAELVSLGYKVELSRGFLLGSLRRSATDPLDGVSVTVSSGRVTGKHWEIDGDMTDVQKRNDWVTVEVIESEVVPLWLKVWLP